MVLFLAYFYLNICIVLIEGIQTAELWPQHIGLFSGAEEYM